MQQHPDTAQQIGALLNLECLGVRDWHTFIVTRRLQTLRSDKRLVKLMRRANPNYRPMICPSRFISDYIPFARVSVPVVELMGYSDAVPSPIHTSNDIPENIDMAEIEEAADTMLVFADMWANQTTTENKERF